MTTETTPQNEQTAGPTLEDVYREYNVEGIAQQFQAATAPKAPQAEVVSDAPDPVTDPDAYRRFQLDQVHRTHEIQQSLQKHGDIVQALYADHMRKQVEADVKRAVDYLQPKFDGVDPELLEVALDNKARRDPRFQKLWEDRSKNPAAWNKALDAFAGEYSKKFSVKSDPQLAENQRAVRASQEAQASTRRAADVNEWDGLSKAEFDAKWRAMLNDA